LHLAAAQAVASATGVDASEVKVDASPRTEHGDLAVGCFAIAKAKGVPPPQLAQQIAAAFAPNQFLASATAAGPFVNFRAQRAATLHWLVDATLRGTLLPRSHGAGKTICIDYGSPNISKHLAYHHIRGTSIGHALAQSFRALGYRVIGINFLGDWGTTHGMVLAAYDKWPVTGPLTVELLHDLYVRFRKEPDAEDQGRAYFKKLEDGEPATVALWQKFRDISWAEFEELYKILNIKYDDLNGESFFAKGTDKAIAELRTKSLLVESEGAQVVKHEGEKTPFIVLTKDGTTLYGTRDLVAADYRWDTYHFDRSLYVVDRGQSLHFKLLFKTLEKLGRDWAKRCQHVAYGQVRSGGKKTGTRLGNVVLMQQVFDIAEDEVRSKIAEVNPTLDPSIVSVVARQVGIGAVIFANLSPQRDKDIDFELDKAVSLDGDSGPYLQYSHARCSAIFRRAGAKPEDVRGADLSKLTHDAEWAVARKLLDFPEIVVRSTDACEPHIICHYLLELAGEFSRWYTLGSSDASLRVLVDDSDLRRARLALVAAAQATLREGLSLLGIAAPDQM
jgi:arginyl-tRNA synthetase